MSIPVQYAQFKSAGVYKLVYDRSTVLNQNAEILRLIVGYSEKGVFNQPVYVKNASEFKSWFGDISKKLEKRGIYFHRTCLQALSAGPIIALNLKPFDESNTVSVHSISGNFNEDTAIVDNKKFPVADLFDRTKFWELEAEKMEDLYWGGNKPYITIGATDAVANSASYFIRKASGNSVAGYKMTVADWYKSTNEDIPEYLEGYENRLVSDFFAEIYLFKGEFKADQVLASESLKRYFDIDGDGNLILKPFVRNPYNDAIDTLDTLFTEEAAGPIAHYVGCLIPLFKDKQGVYRSLDIVFNNDIDSHHLMMNMDFDLFDSEVDKPNIDLSGYALLEDTSAVDDIFTGSYVTNLLGNENATVFADKFDWGIISEKPDHVSYNYGIIPTPCVEDEDLLESQIHESSIGFVNNEGWALDGEIAGYVYSFQYESDEDNQAPFYALASGDTVLAEDGTLASVIEVYRLSDKYPDTTVEDNKLFVSFSKMPYIKDGYFVRIDNPLNQEIGVMKPHYLEGYSYDNLKEFWGTDMMSKLNLQKKILDQLNDTGIHTALINKSEIDYRYVVDAFESFVEDGCKSRLSNLAKDKMSCFAILNFPSVKTFIKCPYASFTNAKGVFNVQYVVDGCNKKKASSVKFTLPGETEGASFCAFYTPLKFSDGYIDSVLPSAALVSNLFMEKYMSRQPYYIVAGPNYGVMSYSGLIGPDYHYSREELNVIEPYGVNCMVYRPGFGTFINANQTAKQLPKSALSSINVRELVIYLQDEVEKILQAYQWEFNNQYVRNCIKDRADAICESIKTHGGIQEFINIIDESNNTPDIIDNEMCVLSTHIEPGRGCGKMIHELTIYRTGGLKSAIIES